MPDPHPQDTEALERLIDRTLRDLSPRAAPPGLAARVRAEFARRAALPWWRRSFTYWPAPVRGAFVAICAGLIALSLLDGARLIAARQVADAAQASVARLSWGGPLSALWNALIDSGSALAGAVPSVWLDAGAALVALAYALLLAVAVAACRVLQVRR
jgi:hypothetical protein